MLIKKKLTPLFEEDGAGGGADPATADPKPASKGEEGSGEPKKADEGAKPGAKYTDADVDRIIDAKFAKWEEKKQKEAEEAAKLAKMNAEEKAKHAARQAEERATAAEAKLASYQMAGQARAMLAEKGIGIGEDLLNTLVDPEAEKTKKNVDAFAEAFTAAVEAEVRERLKGRTPTAGTPSPGLTKQDINNIQDPLERRKKIAENMDLYK